MSSCMYSASLQQYTEDANIVFENSTFIVIPIWLVGLQICRVRSQKMEEAAAEIARDLDNVETVIHGYSG